MSEAHPRIDRVQRGLVIALLPLLVAGLVASVAMLRATPLAFAQHLVNGLTLGGLFALVALGYTMVYGIIELINFAHGEIFMVGSFLGLIVLRVLFGAGISSVWVAVPLALLLAMLGCGALGICVDALAYKPLRRQPAWASVGSAALGIGALSVVLAGGVDGDLSWARVLGALALLGFAGLAFFADERKRGAARSTPRINALLSAIGVSIFLQNLVMLTVGRDTQSFPQLGDFSGLRSTGFDLFGLHILHIEVVTLLASVGLMIGLDQFVSRSRLGKGMRATAQDPEAAMMLGVPVNRVITATFVVGSMLAAAAGILYGLRYGGVKFNDGFLIGVKAFVAAVLGGIGNLRGAMLGGFLLGLSETVVIAVLDYGWVALGGLVYGSAAGEMWPHGEFQDYKDAIAFLILILVLTLRPWGLLGSADVQKV